MARFQVSPEDDGAAITVAVGDELIAALPENPTTGYRWHLGPIGGAVALESDEYSPKGVAPGAAGTRVLTFRAAAPGRAELHLQARREWETAPMQNFLLTVLVDDG